MIIVLHVSDRLLMNVFFDLQVFERNTGALQKAL